MTRMCYGWRRNTPGTVFTQYLRATKFFLNFKKIWVSNSDTTRSSAEWNNTCAEQRGTRPGCQVAAWRASSCLGGWV